MDDIFSDIFGSNQFNPTKIALSRTTLRKLRNLGIRNICFTDHDEAVGPYLKFYLNRKSIFFRQLENNPAFLADLLILSKDMKEILLKDERSLVLFGSLDKTGLRLILVETTKEFKDSSLAFIDNLVERLRGKDLTLEAIENAIEDVLQLL